MEGGTGLAQPQTPSSPITTNCQFQGCQPFLTFLPPLQLCSSVIPRPLHPPPHCCPSFLPCSRSGLPLGDAPWKGAQSHCLNQQLPSILLPPLTSTPEPSQDSSARLVQAPGRPESAERFPEPSPHPQSRTTLSSKHCSSPQFPALNPRSFLSRPFISPRRMYQGQAAQVPQTP